jgi:hypothetical protein
LKQNIEKIINKTHTKYNINILEHIILKAVKQKLTDNNLTVSCGDKGEIVVVIKNEELQNKIRTFANENGHKPLNRDPTTRFQKVPNK